ncbi:hypothetical protein [Palleronia caenipelagi]|uniref:Uncharacterized protein n=1 Tax=Palleronia caenipelagi TaxID=2489174 RepID=A0A547Q5R9_9RHOB|nr:hypothetical protein [Palleronia caenipelagi]TRD21697.1 hypothetical protein FEV53_08125 [Palleronia caenipelagi]
MFGIPTWPDAKAPEHAASDAISDLAQSDPIWSFWARWYDGFLRGEPLDWELQKQIALIPDNDWAKGPAHIARLIEKIEAKARPVAVPDLPAEMIRTHVQNLLASPEFSARTSELAADTVKAQLDLLRNETGWNQLPEELRHLEAVTHHFRNLATHLRAQEDEAAKIEALTKEIKALNARIALLERDLAAKPRGFFSANTSQKVIEAAAICAIIQPFSPLIAQGFHFLSGAFPTDALMQAFDGWIDPGRPAEPFAPDLPEVTDV